MVATRRSAAAAAENEEKGGTNASEVSCRSKSIQSTVFYSLINCIAFKCKIQLKKNDALSIAIELKCE